MNKIQSKLLEIAIYFDEFCKKHDIEYFLMGGSALGAIRHKGFIPWDDDLDVFMSYDQYIKFLNIAENQLDEKYYLQKENTKEWPLLFSKLRMNGTTYFEENTLHRTMHHGFFIDIMCLDNVPDNFISKRIQFIRAKLLVAKTLKERGYNTNNKLKKIYMWIADKYVSKKRKKKLLKKVRKYNDKETKLVGHLFGGAKYKNSHYNRSWFKEQLYVDFENQKLPVMNAFDKYLRTSYGDSYMNNPSQKTRDMYPGHIFYANPDVDYRDIDMKKLLGENKNE